MSRARARLLDFLAGGIAARSTLRDAPNGAGVLLRRRDGRTLLTTDLGLALREGLVLENGTLQLTPEGHAWRRRHHARSSDDPFRRQHQERGVRSVEGPQGRETVEVDRTHSPLGRVAIMQDRHGGTFLDDPTWRAGERLARDFTFAGLLPSITSSWNAAATGPRKGRGGKADLSDAAMDARRRVEGALAALPPELRGVALDVCCFAKGVAQVERERGWPARSAKLMLRAALAVLANHYGLRPVPKARGIRTLWAD